MEECAKTEREPEIEREMHQIEIELDQAEQLFQGLWESIGPIVRPMVEVPKEGNVADIPEPNTIFAQKLARFANRLSKLNTSIAEVRANIEL